MAQSILGVIYGEGRGVPQNYEEAFEWFSKSAEQGLARSEHALGMMYHKGLVVESDTAEALKWYDRAFDQGYFEPQNATSW